MWMRVHELNGIRRCENKRIVYLAQCVDGVHQGEVDDVAVTVANTQTLHEFPAQKEEVCGCQSDQVVPGRGATQAVGRREHTHGQDVAYYTDDDQGYDAVEIRIIDWILPRVTGHVSDG